MTDETVPPKLSKCCYAPIELLDWDDYSKYKACSKCGSMHSETAPRSDCCNALMGISLGDEGTNFHFCMKCKKPCDPLTANAVPRVWWELLQAFLKAPDPSIEKYALMFQVGMNQMAEEVLAEMRRIEQGEK